MFRHSKCLMLVLVALGWLCASDLSAQGTAGKGLKPVTAVELTKAYMDNRNAADKKYSGLNRVAVEGVVKDVFVNKQKEVILTLKGTTEGMSVVCTFNAKQSKEAVKIKVGQKIVAVGSGYGLMDPDVLIGDCKLVPAGGKADPEQKKDTTKQAEHKGPVSSGFNQARGIHAGAKAYKIGRSVADGGESEPGWSGPWRVIDGAGGGSELMQVTAGAAKEGDGGARVKIGGAGQTNLARTLATPQTGKFRIDQWIRSDDPKAAMMARPARRGGFGPNWGIGDGHFRVLDGKGDGSTAPALFRNADEFKPGVWYKVSVVIDVPAQSWEFYVNDKKYETDAPLGFRESPKSLDIVDYLFTSPFDLDAVVVTPLAK